MENPFVQIREGLGLSRGDMCRAARIRYSTLWELEHGLVNRPSARLLAFLESLGYSTDEVLAAYRAYRESVAEQIRKQISA